METMTKSVSEFTAAELKALLAEKEASEAAERQQKRADYESLRDEVVAALVAKAGRIHDIMAAFKVRAWSELETLYKLLQEHSQRHADGKGSFTLECGKVKVQYKRNENTRFDERATQAERHILDFITRKYSDNDPTSKLVRSLLERKKGQLDKDLVLRLISMKDDFQDDNWRKGIELLQESIVPGETRYYAQFFVKDEDGESWHPIVLDFAKLAV